MADIERFRPGDERAVKALYRRVFGTDAADASRLRWDWQYRRNPNNPPDGPQIWVAREGTAVIGQYATMPVQIAVRGQTIPASWGTDVMVAPERQRQGLGEQLFRTWDRHVGASLGLGPSESAAQLFRKLRWPDLGVVPCLAKPLTRRAFWRAAWSPAANRVVAALAAPFIRIVARARPSSGEIQPIRRFGPGFTALWQRIAPRFDCAVQRDAAYLNWKFATPPHVRYAIVALARDGVEAGYAVYRHLQEPVRRVTLLIDFLTDPDDHDGLRALLARVDEEARMADSDTIRCYALHAGFRRILRSHGYFETKSNMRLVAKINAVEVTPGFYQRTEGWHVTLGDSDQDR